MYGALGSDVDGIIQERVKGKLSNFLFSDHLRSKGRMRTTVFGVSENAVAMICQKCSSSVILWGISSPSRLVL